MKSRDRDVERERERDEEGERRRRCRDGERLLGWEYRASSLRWGPRDEDVGV